jgi:large subunit ribosomal protein L43
MATRGVTQLQKLSIVYCEHGGSSRAVRSYLGSKNGHRLAAWAAAHPDTAVEVVVRNGRHPHVAARYRTQAVQHQVCVKNRRSWREIEAVLDQLANRSGRKIKRIVNPVVTDTPSIQGVWTPFLNLQHEAPFKVEIVEGEGGDS